jgi:hypothetical protein
MLANNLALKGSWGLFNQFLFTTNDENAILQIVDFWQPVQKKFNAISNQHYILGLEKWFDERFNASIEAYYKPYSNVLTNNPSNDPALRNDEFISGEGNSWGVEVLLKKTAGKLSGWVGYAYSSVRREFDFNNDGTIRRSANEMSEIYAPRYSRPHSFNLVTAYQMTRKTQISMSWTIASGQPYTPVVGKVFYGGGNLDSPYEGFINIQGERNSSRYPLYLRGDIAWMRDISSAGIEGKIKVQIINFTNHFNVLTYVWNHNSSPSEVRAISMFPFFPSVGLELAF